MFCFVSLPNSLVIEIEVDIKAKGQECLDKVCDKLGIIEVDYFGLRYLGPKGEQLWLNLRNRLSKQVGSTGTSSPCRFLLRVKFFVQPHYLLQQTTRHLFYLQLKVDILDGTCKFLERKHVASTEEVSLRDEVNLQDEVLNESSNLLAPYNESQITETLSLVTKSLLLVELCALIAQAEVGDYKPGQSYENYVPSQKAEDDEFVKSVEQSHSRLVGVHRTAAENRFLRRSSSMGSYGVEYHAVKNGEGQAFYLGVGPEGISVYDCQWQMTRSVPYPTIKMATHKGRFMFLHTYKLDGSTNVLGVKLVSEHGANALYRAVTEMHSFYRCDTVRGAVSAQFSRDLKGTLASLFNEDTTLGKKYVFDIRRTCKEAYEHARRTLYKAEQALSQGSKVSTGTLTSLFALGSSVPAGLDTLSCDKQGTVKSLPSYNRRRRHKSSNIDEGGGGKILRKEELEYSNSRVAEYNYPSVTCKLEPTKVVVFASEPSNELEEEEMEEGNEMEDCHDSECNELGTMYMEALKVIEQQHEENQKLREHLENIDDALRCRVCLCERIGAVFCPCGHLVCCNTCASKIAFCPLCRSDVEHTQQVYLPISDCLRVDTPLSPSPTPASSYCADTCPTTSSENVGVDIGSDEHGSVLHSTQACVQRHDDESNAVFRPSSPYHQSQSIPFVSQFTANCPQNIESLPMDDLTENTFQDVSSDMM